MKLKFLIIVFSLLALALCICAKPVAADTVPLAARLLAEPYETTGIRVTVSNLGSMYGLATDGTNAYAVNSDGKVVSVPLANIAALDGGSATTTTGTIHNVGWGVSGAPSWPDSSQLSLAYSHGCLFTTNNSNDYGSIHLYCIDVSDYSVTDVTVPPAKPLPAGYYYVISSLIDFPDGRIGKVSGETYSDAHSQYESTLRTYTLTGTGKNVIMTWSEDFTMGDPDNFAVDEHGIATDGTYLYRIQWRDYNPNTKVWTLTSGSIASVVYSGQFTMPFDNMHFLSHNHTNSYYLVGHFANNHFFITKAADPGPGPGNALTPTFSTATSTSGGYTSQITNYDSNFNWAVFMSVGSGSINGSGLLTVSGLSSGQRATATVSTTRTGYPSGSSTVSGIAATSSSSSESESTSTSINTTVSNLGGSGRVFLPKGIGSGVTDASNQGLGSTVDVGPITPLGINVLTYQTNVNNFVVPESGSGWSNGSHSFTINNLDLLNKTATITFNSNPVTVTMKKGETRQIDLDSDGTPDVEATFVNIYISRVEITVKSLAKNTVTNPTTTDNIVTNNSTVKTTKFIFTKNLSLGTINNDVKELQKFLNVGGFTVAKTGPGSLGKETTKFGLATRNALMKFQKAKKISPAQGYFGVKTRNSINK